MFLSKKWIFILISISGISFLVLLVIQFRWITKSIELDRQHFDDRMMVILNKIDGAFLSDKLFQKTYLSGSEETKDFVVATNRRQTFEGIIHYKVDSVLEAEKAPLSASIIGRTGNSCYLMNFVPAELHNAGLDHSQYKLCLCNNSYDVALDIGINLVSSGKMLETGSPGLIIPSVILILLLIALFAYAIFVINRQKSLAELKNDFINNLTHEFNTPLFSIGLTSNLLLRSEPVHQSGKLKSYVELITTEKNRLQAQVDKILRLTAIESGNLLLEKETVDMHQLMEQNIEAFEPLITEKGGTVAFKPGAAHYSVEGDRIHLFNALSNLLDNALKYSDKKPEIVVATSNPNNQLIISFTDNGIGMNKAEINLIFNKYYRVKHGERHDVKGFGLGLSYVKKIVELHKGSVEVKSKPGHGSVFIIHLPLPVN